MKSNKGWCRKIGFCDEGGRIEAKCFTGECKNHEPINQGTAKNGAAVCR